MYRWNSIKMTKTDISPIYIYIFFFFFKYFYCISSDFSDLPDMTGEYIVLSVVYSTG